MAAVAWNRSVLNQKLLTERTSMANCSLKFCPVCKGSGDGNGLGHCLACGGKGHIVEHNPFGLFAKSPWVVELLASIIRATSADFGNVQLFDSAQRALKITAQQGFGKEFLSYFRTVWTGEFCCGAALKKRSRIVVQDVVCDPLFQDAVCKQVMLRARVRSCQSSPLIDGSGRLIGVVSTHFDRPRKFSPRLWKAADDLITSFIRELPSQPSQYRF
jgi:hypothetical protein